MRHYIGGWFLCDLVSTFPWDAAASMAPKSRQVKTPILQLLSLIRVLRVLRAPRIIHRITCDWAIHSVKIGFFLYMIFTLLVAHIMGCLFFLCPVVFKSVPASRARANVSPSKAPSLQSRNEVSPHDSQRVSRQKLKCLRSLSSRGCPRALLGGEPASLFDGLVG